MSKTPETFYSQAALLASDPRIATSLSSMAQLCHGWTEFVSPGPVHKLLAENLPVPDGRTFHQGLFLQLSKVEGGEEELLTVNHARLWQFLSLRFLPNNPSGLVQFQMELSIVLESLAGVAPKQKPVLKLV